MNKKSLIWTLASLMVLASMILAACGGGATPTPVATEPAVQEPAATEPPATEAPTQAATEAAASAPAANAAFPVVPGGELEKALTGAYKGTTVTVDGAFDGLDPDGVKFAESVKAFEEA